MMKIAVVLLVVCLAAVAMAYDGYGGYDRYGGYGHDRYGYGNGLRPVHGGVAAPYRNDLRQIQVNHQAEHYGAGTGTARHYGVPGSGNNFGYRRGYGGYQ